MSLSRSIHPGSTRLKRVERWAHHQLNLSVSQGSVASAGKLRRYYQIKGNVICKKNNSIQDWRSHELYTLLAVCASSISPNIKKPK